MYACWVAKSCSRLFAALCAFYKLEPVRDAPAGDRTVDPYVCCCLVLCSCFL